MAESRSSRALNEWLSAPDKSEQRALRNEFHPTLLSSYRNGHKKPRSVSAAKLERLSGGAVPANGWEDTTETSDHRTDSLSATPETEHA